MGLTLDSTANKAFTLDFYTNSACDPSGFGEGQTFVGTSQVALGIEGPKDFHVSLPISIPNGRSLVVTATDEDGNTSEFSPCLSFPTDPPGAIASGDSWNPSSGVVATGTTVAPEAASVAG